jgi:hypothetical protein
MSVYPTVFKPSNDVEVSASECPEHFVEFLFDLMNHNDGSWKKDQGNENAELEGFIGGKISLRVSSIFGHVERLFIVIQAAQIVGPDALQEMEDLIAKHEDAYMSWDPAAYQDWLDESEYGSLLSLQELPGIACHFLNQIIQKLELNLFECERDSPEEQLYDFKEHYIHLSPSDITNQFGKLFEIYLQKTSNS